MPIFPTLGCTLDLKFDSVLLALGVAPAFLISSRQKVPLQVINIGGSNSECKQTVSRMLVPNSLQGESSLSQFACIQVCSSFTGHAAATEGATSKAGQWIKLGSRAVNINNVKIVE